MNADELMARIIEYGADEDGIKDRFSGNNELYEGCFQDFMEEPNFAALKSAMEGKDYPAAFEAAHALKGLSGNLGLTDFYKAICALVEPLRAKSYSDVDALYLDVCRQKENLERMLSGKAMAEKPAPEPDTAVLAVAKAPVKRKKPDWYVIVSLATILTALFILAFMFFQVSLNYQETMTLESGRHLEEMSGQIKLYIEQRVTNDWKVARSVGDSILDMENAGDAAVLNMLQRRRVVWGVTDLMLYTENGYSVYSNGGVEMNDTASDTIAKARSNGRYMSIIDSRITYTIPVETQLEYNGSRIVAVSVVQDMGSFLDEMNFSSFADQAWMYLTEDTGIVISMLTNPAATPTFNFMAVAREMEITPLDDANTAADLLKTESAATYLMSDGNDSVYVVSMPIITGVTPMRLFYLAPESVVNQLTNQFSNRLTTFSLTTVVLFAVLAFLAFFFVYRNRKQIFDQELKARDRMFDLLASNTRTAFALFSVNEIKPAYISGNCKDVIGDEYWTLDKRDGRYKLRSGTGADSASLAAANEMLKSWDGQGDFKSGYIKNESADAASYFEFQLYPVDGSLDDFIGIAEDVTNAYEREQVTKDAMEMANQANDAKSRFLSNMSHDIRTPMNAIMNMTNFALESIDQPKKLGTYLRTIRESSEHLLQLINDVLDMSRIESGLTTVSYETFDLENTIRRQAEIARPLCQAKNQTLITDFSGLNTTRVKGDSLKLSQIVMNLLSNAVKFTPDKGAVRFTAKEIPSLRDDLVDISFVIEDNGIGIAKEDLEHIFEPFHRANDKRVTKIEGTGLGLSICKSYVDAMGGSISCESEVGEGTTFTVELFFQRTEASEGEAEIPETIGELPFLGMRCLVVEDNPTNQIIAKSLLERLGFIADFASDGSEGVKQFIESKPGMYDIVFMDIQMPVMDGYQAAAKIRESDHPLAKSMPIVAMTANVLAEDIEKARAAGMDGYLSKPIVSFDLIEQTTKAIKKRSNLE